MAFEIDEVVAQMLGAVKASVKDDWKLVKETAGTFLQTRKDRLELLASLRLNNEISQKFFLKRLEDEKRYWNRNFIQLLLLPKRWLKELPMQPLMCWAKPWRNWYRCNGCYLNHQLA